MCFVNDDYDWIASVFDTDDRVSDGTVRCDECRRTIRAGMKYEHVDMRQYECCRVCDRDTRAEWDDEYDDEDIAPCADDSHDFGESDEQDACEECQKFLGAIQRVEADEGCRAHESRPPYGELCEALRETDSAVAYIDRARNEHPELALSGYLDRMYERTHEWDRFFEDQWDAEDIGPVDELGGEG